MYGLLAERLPEPHHGQHRAQAERRGRSTTGGWSWTRSVGKISVEALEPA